MNDGGEDVSDVVLQFSESKDIQFKYIHNEKPSGRSNAANQCLENANGFYSIFLDDDDWFSETHTEGLVKAIETDGESVLSYTGCRAVDENRVEIREYSADLEPENIFIENFIPINSYLFKTDAGRNCRFENEFLIYEDWDFLIQLFFVGKFIKKDGFTAFYEIAGGGSSDVHNPEISRNFRRKIYEKWSFKLPPEIINFLADEGLKSKKLEKLEDEMGELTNFLEVHFKNSLDVNLTKEIIPKSDFYIQLFVDSGKGFDELNSMRKGVNLREYGIPEFVFDLSAFKEIKSIRIDPLNIPNVCEILKLELLCRDGSINILENISENAYARKGNIFYFQTSDSAFIVDDIQSNDVTGFKIVLKFLKTGENALDDIIEYERQQTYKYAKIAEENLQKGKFYLEQLKDKQTHIDKQASEKSELQTNINNINAYNEQLKKIIYQQEYEYFTLINSRTWKIMGFFRNTKSFFKKLLKSRK